MNDEYASRRLRGFQDASDALMKMKEERYGKKRKRDKEKEGKLNKTPKTTDKIEVSILWKNFTQNYWHNLCIEN